MEHAIAILIALGAITNAGVAVWHSHRNRYAQAAFYMAFAAWMTSVAAL